MSVVYFVRRTDGTGPIKIGCTANLDQRIRALSYHAQADLAVLATAPGSFREERRLHRQFDNDRQEGEWFEPTDALLQAVAYVANKGQLPPADEEDREIVMSRRYLAGETLREIAEDFGLTRERVRQILRSSNIPSLGFRARHRRAAKPITDREREIAGVYADGATRPADICETYGITASRLKLILDRTKTPSFPVGHWLTHTDDAERTAKVKKLYDAGVKTAEIARLVGLNHQTHVYRYLSKGGVRVCRRAKLDTAVIARGRIVADYQDGVSVRDIGRTYGHSIQTIRSVLEQAGFPMTREAAEARRIEAVRAANARRALARSRAA